ncbi:MAG: glycosyl hydrolase, partial [Kiritimatiellae bacterium]|nr:glycosyl hydrolase [Kiritimatiellia bacterium]
DQGIFMYTNEARAIDQYWYDVDEQVFPPGFNHSALAILWADGGAYATWFSGAPEAIHGITFLPITGGSLYLGRDPAYVLTNYLDMVAHNGGPEDQWQDIIWSHLALADPALTVAKFAANPEYTPEDGESRAHTYHWIHNLNALGQVDTTVTADIPTYAVFDHDGQRTYVAYNAGEGTAAVHFSDGMLLGVGPRNLVAEPAPDCSGAVGFSRFADFVTCMQGPEEDAPGACRCARLDGDDDADLADFALLQGLYVGGAG